MNNIIPDLKKFISDRGDEKIKLTCNKRWARESSALMSIDCLSYRAE